MSRRPLLKADQWSALVDIPPDVESLIRHCTLDRAELDLIQAKHTPHDRLGLTIQLCFLRHLGRAILSGETSPAPMVAFVAQQIGVNPGALAEYAKRDTNRREHAIEAQRHLGLHPRVREDRRAALTEALFMLVIRGGGASSQACRAASIIKERARIKRQTIEHRRLQHRKLAA